jgi:glycosyltransferase involved in cell wall biosynthesis
MTYITASAGKSNHMPENGLDMAVDKFTPGQQMTCDKLPTGSSRHAICLVGPGWRFTSGISYYTCQFANALADHHRVSVIQMRQLLPQFLYPGSNRVGQPRARDIYRSDVEVCDGINWWWGRSLFRALSFMISRPPEILVLQWWTATVLHSYLVLVIMGRLLGARIVLEVHELQDSGEAHFSFVRRYGRWGLRLLLRLSHSCMVHSAADWEALKNDHDLRNLRIATAPHGPFNQYHPSIEQRPLSEDAIAAVKKAPRPGVINFLFFGTIRPYKGLEDLLKVFNGLEAEEVSNLWLTVVGETWENCKEPADLIAASPHRDRITFVNDYVPDEVVSAAFAHADVVVLPYRRSSSSGPLHIAMSWGLPVILTRVGGLPEAAKGYDGAVFAAPGDGSALKTAIRQAARLVGQRFEDPRSWTDSIDALLSAADVQSNDRNLRWRQHEDGFLSSIPRFVTNRVGRR